MDVLDRSPAVAHTPPHFFADLYSYDWSKLTLRLPLASSFAVAICLIAGLLAGHPGGGLIAAGGAFTIGFGANQRIADSRLAPMLAGVWATSTATLAGTVAGHKNLWLVLFAAASAFIYGVLTTRASGLSWVGQQACVALVVASGFPTGPQPALIRAGLIAAGGLLQIVVTTLALQLMPDLRKDLHELRTSLLETVHDRRELLERLWTLPQVLPAFSRSESTAYSVRLAITAGVACEIYRRIGLQSGYWIPMTAVLVQKPAFSETFSRATARIAGTLVGAWACTLLIANLSPQPAVLALFTTLFALLSFMTNPVNYGLFSACLTSYIVFLLSLNAMPGPVIAQRRAWCTILGGLVALLIHLDVLRAARHLRPMAHAKP